ncbi:MAG: LuxR C-terminal-related transcriptional regulator [Actinomycetota bacterium]
MAASPTTLTARQEQILALLRTGKANKEIAEELGIGIGTVKQHLVALFKRLGVTNRAMAVGSGLVAPQAAEAEASDTQLELRPCCVLSVSSDDSALLQRHAAIASAAFDCALLASAGGADIIFGLQRVGENDAINAVELARQIAAAMWAEGAGVVGGLEAGNLAASMNLSGGWSGEIVAGRLVAQARALRQSAGAGRLAIGPVAKTRIAMHLRATVEDPACLPSDIALAAGIDGVLGMGPPPPPSLVGRPAERACIFRHLAELTRGRGSVLLIEGEAGMGKTALARTAAQPGIPWFELHCGGTPFPAFRRADRGKWAADVVGWRELAATQDPVLALVDDIHLAGAHEREAIEGLIDASVHAPLLLVCTGRTSHRIDRLRQLGDEHVVVLRRMPEGDIRQLLAQNGAANPGDDLVELAAGVPLFACQLARAAAEGVQVRLPNALVALVSARVDALGLHRGFLRVAAMGTTRLAAIASALSLSVEDVDALANQAARAGVVAFRGGRWPAVSFCHPLVKAVLEYTLGGFADRPGDADIARATASVRQFG